MSSIFFVLLRWELKNYLSDKAAVFWTFAFPFLLFAVLTAAFGGPTMLGTVRLEIVDRDRTPMSASFVALLRQAFEHNETVSADIASVDGSAPQSASDLRLAIPSGFSQAISDGRHVDMTLTYDGAGSIAIRAAAQFIKGLNTEFNARALNVTFVSDVVLKDDNETTKELNYSEYLIAGVIVMSTISTCVLGLSVPLVAMREAEVLKTYSGLLIPTASFMAALIASRALICLGFITTFLLGARFVFHNAVPLLNLAFFQAIAVVGIAAATFLALGQLIGSRLKSVTTASAVANAVYFPLIFLSDLMIPAKGFPEAIGSLLSISPATAFVQALRHILFSAGTLGTEWRQISLLGIWAAVLLLLAHVSFAWRNA